MVNPSYDPFGRGPMEVNVGTLEAHDTVRGRHHPCEIWSPAQPGRYPLVAFSHSSGGDRRQSSFLCMHLASHGYIVAALDHSERLAPELKRPEGESEVQRSARIRSWIDNRVPDMQLLLDRMLDASWWNGAAMPDPDRVGVTGHSFGGWTALALPEADARVRAIVALAPAGASNPPPGIIPATLTFRWGRDVPTLYLVAEDDTALALDAMRELFERTQSARSMFVLRNADHGHFFDAFERRPGQCPADEAHRFTQALALAHFDQVLKEDRDATAWLGDGVEGALSAHGVSAYIYREAP